MVRSVFMISTNQETEKMVFGHGVETLGESTMLKVYREMVRVLVTDLANEKSAQTRPHVSHPASEPVGNPEACYSSTSLLWL